MKPVARCKCVDAISAAGRLQLITSTYRYVNHVFVAVLVVAARKLFWQFNPDAFYLLIFRHILNSVLIFSVHNHVPCTY